MARVRDIATVTVAETIRPKRRRRQRKDTDLTVVVVNPEVLAVALELAGGDRERLVVRSEVEVMVINQRRR